MNNTFRVQQKMKVFFLDKVKLLYTMKGGRLSATRTHHEFHRTVISSDRFLVKIHPPPFPILLKLKNFFLRAVSSRLSKCLIRLFDKAFFFFFFFFLNLCQNQTSDVSRPRKTCRVWFWWPRQEIGEGCPRERAAVTKHNFFHFSVLCLIHNSQDSDIKYNWWRKNPRCQLGCEFTANPHILVLIFSVWIRPAIKTVQTWIRRHHQCDKMRYTSC